MTHSQTEQAIAKAELLFFQTHPHRSSESIARSAVVVDRVFLYDLRGRVVAQFKITATKNRLSVVEERRKA